jgi:hypothetical protein
MPNEDDKDTVPAQKSDRTRPRQPIRDVRWKVDQIEAIAMTADQYEVAVQAFAVLINRWWNQQRMREKRGKGPRP